MHEYVHESESHSDADYSDEDHYMTYEEFVAKKHGHHSARRHLSDSDDSDSHGYEHDDFRHHYKAHQSRKDYDEEE